MQIFSLVKKSPVLVRVETSAVHDVVRENRRAGEVVHTHTQRTSSVPIPNARAVAPASDECTICTETQMDYSRCSVCHRDVCLRCFDRISKCPFCRTSFLIDNTAIPSDVMDSFNSVITTLENAGSYEEPIPSSSAPVGAWQGEAGDADEDDVLDAIDYDTDPEDEVEEVYTWIDEIY
jgi:hypothetical protein